MYSLERLCRRGCGLSAPSKSYSRPGLSSEILWLSPMLQWNFSQECWTVWSENVLLCDPVCLHEMVAGLCQCASVVNPVMSSWGSSPTGTFIPQCMFPNSCSAVFNELNGFPSNAIKKVHKAHQSLSVVLCCTCIWFLNELTGKRCHIINTTCNTSAEVL